MHRRFQIRWQNAESFHELTELLSVLNGINNEKGLFDKLKEESIDLEEGLLLLDDVELNKTMLALQESVYDFLAGDSLVHV